ncbi:hypothetical protein [Aquimarina sp. AU58]|nr:hypothetical protein [Aquimarina sp. AU58]
MHQLNNKHKEYKNKSAKELWSSEFGDLRFKESKLVSATDSLFKVK